jgi:hypothetical protein
VSSLNFNELHLQIILVWISFSTIQYEPKKTKSDRIFWTILISDVKSMPVGFATRRSSEALFFARSRLVTLRFSSYLIRWIDRLYSRLHKIPLHVENLNDRGIFSFQ